MEIKKDNTPIVDLIIVLLIAVAAFGLYYWAMSNLSYAGGFVDTNGVFHPL